jgi:F5/8 type C domain/Carbohydrate binding domain
MLRPYRRSLTASLIGLVILGSIGAFVLIKHNSNSPRAHAAAGYAVAPYVYSQSSLLNTAIQQAGLGAFTEAFVVSTGGCTPEWDGGSPVSSDSGMKNQISQAQSMGAQAIISFGGALDGSGESELAQTCTNVSSLTSAYQSVLTNLKVTHLDFDIEGGVISDSAANDRRNQALAALQSSNPGVSISYTLAGDTSGLGSDQMNLLRSAISRNAKVDLVNVMTMDNGASDSGSFAVSTAKATLSQLKGIYSNASYGMIGLTPMIGHNDDYGDNGEQLTLANAKTIVSFAQANGLGRLAFWSLNRDQQCSSGQNSGDSCSGVSQSTLDFTKIFTSYSPSSTPQPSTPTPTPTSPANGTVLNRSGWTATASSTPTDPCCTGDAPANVLDGNSATRWSSGVAQAANQWFQVDMKATKSFNSISMDAGSSTGDYPHGYQVFVSNDGSNWGSAIASGSGTTQLVTVSFATQSARYIKVTQTGSAGNWWSIHEFNVYGSTAPVNTPTQPPANTPTKVPTQPPANTPTQVPTQPPASTPTRVPTQPSTSGMVNNGGFEAGNTSGWTCDAGTNTVTSPVNSGSYALQLNPTDSLTGQCTQTITVQANHAYTLSAYVQGNYAYLGINGGASTWTNSSGYAKLSVPFTTGTSQTSITIYVHGWYAQGSIYVDDVTLQ